MLWNETGFYFGGKTGVTLQAGPCLCVNYKKDEHDLIAVVLHCKSKEVRFTEIPKLIKWATLKV